MAGYTALPTKNPGDLLTSALWNTYLQGNADSGFMRMLADTTLVATAAIVTLASIPQTFAHLLLVCYGRSTAAATSDSLALQFNGDTAANYDYQVASTSAGAASGSEVFATTSIQVGLVPGSTAPANAFGTTAIYIPHYTGSTNNKTLKSDSACKIGTTSGSLFMRQTAGFWRSNNAITQIALIANQLAIGCRFTLYGLPH